MKYKQPWKQIPDSFDILISLQLKLRGLSGDRQAIPWISVLGSGFWAASENLDSCTCSGHFIYPNPFEFIQHTHLQHVPCCAVPPHFWPPSTCFEFACPRPANSVRDLSRCANIYFWSSIELGHSITSCEQVTVWNVYWCLWFSRYHGIIDLIKGEKFGATRRGWFIFYVFFLEYKKN